MIPSEESYNTMTKINLALACLKKINSIAFDNEKNAVEKINRIQIDLIAFYKDSKAMGELDAVEETKERLGIVD